jgi:hypothetical protein
MGKLSRQKGAGWERELAIILRKLWPSAKRGLGQARSGGEVCDVDGTPFWVEAKVGTKTNLKAAVKQAEAATDGRPVIAVCKDNAKPGKMPDVWVAMRLETFERVVKTSEFCFVPMPSEGSQVGVVLPMGPIKSA